MKTTLYAKDNKGKIRVWSIWYDEDTITMSSGLYRGEEIEKTEPVHFGLGGRTKKQQIEMRVNSRINKKLDSGYVYSLENAQNDVRTNQLGYLKPAKCSRWDQEHKNVPYDLTFIQPKLNGYHCSIVNDGGNLIAYSSNGKILKTVDHILEGIVTSENFAVEGELYIHGMPLQKIGSLVRKVQDDNKRLRFYAYDTNVEGDYQRRLKVLNSYDLGPHAEALQTSAVYGRFDIDPIISSYLKRGYEGAVVRLCDYPYEPGIRSKGVIKVKPMHFGKFKIDDEFLIVDIVSSKDGWAIFVCETEFGVRFKCSCFGEIKFKEHVYKNREKYIGKHVRIEFGEWTEDKKPFHPVAICFREKFDE